MIYDELFSANKRLTNPELHKQASTVTISFLIFNSLNPEVMFMAEMFKIINKALT